MGLIDYKGFYEYFYNVLLASANSVPIQSLWISFFTNPVDLNRATQAGLYENGAYGSNWMTVVPAAAVNTAQGALGILFANAVKIPGEGINTQKIGVDGSSGLIKGNIGLGRKDLETVNISYLDTNLSFTDFNIRPWVAMVGHKSLKDDSLKTTLTVIQFAKTGYDKLLSPRTIWTFHGACPVSIGQQQINYGADKPIYRDVEFVYNHYQINSNPLDIIANIKSVFDPSKSKIKSQPKAPTGGGRTGNSNGQQQTVDANDSTSLNSHTNQQISVDEGDMLKRQVLAGMDILNGGGKNASSNIKIPQNDYVDNLLKNGRNILNQLIRNDGNDVPIMSDITFQPVKVEADDVVTHSNNKSFNEERVQTSDNAKSNIKDNSDTPIFFPGDGDKYVVKIAGQNVSGNSDTPQTNQLQTTIKKATDNKLGQIKHENIVIRNDTVERVESQEVPIQKQELDVKTNTVSIKKERVMVTSNTIPAEKNKKLSHNDNKLVSIQEFDISHSINEIKNIKSNKSFEFNSEIETIAKPASDRVGFETKTLTEYDTPNHMENETIAITRDKSLAVSPQVIKLNINDHVDSSVIKIQEIKIAKKKVFGS